MVSIKCIDCSIDCKWETHKNLFYIRIIRWLSLLEHSEVQSLARWNTLLLFCRQRGKLLQSLAKALSSVPTLPSQFSANAWKSPWCIDWEERGHKWCLAKASRTRSSALTFSTMSVTFSCWVIAIDLLTLKKKQTGKRMTVQSLGFYPQ